jgi:outer membrane protein assembly factor BamA
MMIAVRVGFSKLLIGIVLLAALLAIRPTHVAAVQIVERIIIRGNTHTRDKTIRHEIGIAETQPFDVDDLENVRHRLHTVGFFLIVAVSAQPGSSRGLVTLDIAVVEKPLPYVAGFSSTENFIAEARMCQGC